MCGKVANCKGCFPQKRPLSAFYSPAYFKHFRVCVAPVLINRTRQRALEAKVTQISGCSHLVWAVHYAIYVMHSFGVWSLLCCTYNGKIKLRAHDGHRVKYPHTFHGTVWGLWTHIAVHPPDTLHQTSQDGGSNMCYHGVENWMQPAG